MHNNDLTPSAESTPDSYSSSKSSSNESREVKTDPILEYRPRQYLSVSTLLDFVRCPRRYFYSKCGLTKPEILTAPNFGNALHAAFPVALVTGDIKLAMNAFNSVWGETESQLDDIGEEDPKRNRSRATQILMHFIFTHQGSKSLYTLERAPPGTLETDERTSDYEVPWSIDVGLPIPFTGRFDSFGRHRDTDDRWIVEFKTKSSWMGGLNSRFFEAFELNPQLLTYCLAGLTLTGEPPKGVMVEGVLVDQRKVDNLTHPVPVNPHQIEGIVKWIQYYGRMLLECEGLALTTLENGESLYTASQTFTQNFAGCSPYPWFYDPGFPCEYKPLCTVNDWTGLTSLYDIRPEHNFLKLTVDET